MEQDMKQITKERLKEWSACADGYRWFLEKFPKGGQYADVYTALVNDGRCDDACWLADRAFALMCTVDQVSQTLAVASAKVGSDPGETTTGDWANAATTGEGANAATTGYRANAATTGYRANAATTGDWANAATTGYRANAATTGYRANAATTGYRANAATTGEGANAATTGDWANAATTGEGAVACSLGACGSASAGEGGAIMLVCRDDHGRILHVFASKVGENGIKPGVAYRLGIDGKPEQVEAE